MAEAKKHARRLALLDAAGGVEPLGTGSPCADCAKPRTALNTAICWSDAAKTWLTSLLTKKAHRMRLDPSFCEVQPARALYRGGVNNGGCL